MEFFTIGHSNHSADHLVALLRAHGVTGVADVRSQPYSRYAVDFNRELISQWLSQAGIAYVFLGDLLGGRPRDERFYLPDGRVRYGEMAKSEEFLSGVQRLEEGASAYRIAIMCGEENPARCHRHLLVSRVLIGRGHDVQHIRGDGRVQPAAELLASKENQPRQMNMLEDEELDEWTSTPSVSPSGRRSSSSSH